MDAIYVIKFGEAAQQPSLTRLYPVPALNDPTALTQPRETGQSDNAHSQPLFLILTQEAGTPSLSTPLNSSNSHSHGRFLMVKIPKRTLDLLELAMTAGGSIGVTIGIGSLVNGPPFDFWRAVAVVLGTVLGSGLILCAAILQSHERW